MVRVISSHDLAEYTCRIRIQIAFSHLCLIGR
jgi:hypothetical protein